MAVAVIERSESTTDAAFPTVVVVIPALNEEQSIAAVVTRLPKVGAVIVVDNGSVDATADRARDAGACVITEPRRGYGSACLAGLAEVARRAPPPDVVVFIDADGADTPEQLPELVRPILDGDVDFVLASRMRGEREPGAMPPVAVFGNRLASGLMRIGWGAPYSDLGPFRAIKYERLNELGMRDPDFGWTMEMQIKAWRAGLRVREVPCDYRRRVGVSKISGTIRGSVAAGTKILWTLARYGWGR